MPRRMVESVEENAAALREAMSARALSSREAADVLKVKLRTAQKYLARLVEEGEAIRLGWTCKAVFAIVGSQAAQNAKHLPTPVGRAPAPEKPFSHTIVAAAKRKPNTNAPRWIFDAHQKHLNRRRPV